ncbi:MAG TPA: hypothetical protein VH188_11230 [Chthoniobacterales bacterium]|nr:hypothetical protein [Chthoniobacterales bacterium]
MPTRKDDYKAGMLRARWQRAIVLSGALFASAVAQIRAADVVVPNALLTQQGDTGNLLPILSQNQIRYQQVFDHTQFATFAAGGEYITQIAFRVHSPGIRFTASISGLQVNLSTTTKAVDALSSTFAANVGADDTVVFPQASVQFSSSVAGAVDGPQAFDLVITFPTPFHYDPAQGNLLVDIRNASGATHDPANDQEIDATSATGDATSRVYNLGDVNAASAGTTGSSFQMDTLGAVMRFVSTLTAPTVTPPHILLNSATRMHVGTGDNVLIGGFIIRGGSKKVILRGTGPSLAGAGVQGALADPTLELHGSAGELITSNDNWVSSPQKQEIIDSGIPPKDDREPAIVATLAEGNYTAVLAGVGGTSGVGLIEIYDLDRSATNRLLNLATRGRVETGDNVMIAGLIVGGTQNTRIIIRALGPSLATLAPPVPDALADPTLELRDAQGNLLETNDDWVNSPYKQVIMDSTLAPPNDKESAILRALPPANYTAIVRGVNDATGIGLVELYNLD